MAANGSGGGGGAGGGNIKVVVRVRPFNNRELERKAKCVVEMKGNQTVLVPAPDPRSKSNKGILEGTKTFAFDKSYWSFNKDDQNYAGQDDLFGDLGRPLLDNAFQGYNNCIFAYGQTGSGKSYSMMGYGAEEGVIPKICRDMFQRIGAIQQDPNLACTVEVSYLEIYNERVRDLLNPSTKGNLKVREHPSTGPYVEDLAKLVVRSFPEIENLMDEGNKARTVAATNMNETSSRSHAVFTLTLTQRRHDVETNMDSEKVAKISLVDLAGSERATSTGATGARLKEGAEINRSLSTLGRVIAALADLSTGKKNKGSMVPYRDSVLTWLLKDSLGGNSLTAMIAAISPADINFEETLSTLRYADSAKRIKNHAVVNEDPNARMIRELKEELAQLRSKLGGGGAGAGGIVQEQYPAGTPLDQQFVSILQTDGSIKKVSKAEIAEQLSQSEKLYQDLNQTWEQKLQKTEHVHREREAALEELGISIEKGFVGLSTPKRMPHLVNLSDDPLLAECLVYNLKPGATTVGNVDTSQSADIRLNGSKILHEHCTFENVDGVVTVVPVENAAVMVNGVRIEQPKRLRSGFRVILGDFHIFRFNHPQEARAERAEEGSRLKHSMAVGDLDSPSIRPGHDRTLSSISRPDSEVERDRSSNVSPIPYRGDSRESDWSFARKEAISAVLGSDPKMSTLTDDELDSLFEDLQRVRAVRRARPESRLVDHADDETDSVNSYPTRDKYSSNGLDNFSMDTVLTMPSTSQQTDEDEKIKTTRENMQVQLDQRKEKFNTDLKDAEASNVELEQIRAEKQQMAESLKAMKEEMEQQLQTQKEEHRQQIAKYNKEASERSGRPLGLSEEQLEVIKELCRYWRQRRYVAMAAAVLQNAVELKEAQIMSHKMDKNVMFQFAVADLGHSLGSTYDLVLNDVSADDDHHLLESLKPSTVVRVIDFRHTVAHLWSLEKLHARVKSMRQMYQYLDKPDYIQHFKLDNPFSEACLPEYTRIGDTDIPLAAVFECKVQDFTLDVYSPFTFTVIGIIRLSLEPSSAEAPSSTLKFNCVMHEFVGFPEREGTNVHAQLFFPGISSDEEGATTTQMVAGFDEGPVKFESIHSMSIATDSPADSTLRISLFASATSMHLDKLLSWDDMRDVERVPPRKRKRARLGEHEFYSEENYDMFARVQIQEIGEDGSYQPVEVVLNNPMDTGAYQLHQGLQRRVVIEMTSTAGALVPWTDVGDAKIGRLQLVDAGGKVTNMSNEQAVVPLSLVGSPVLRTNRDYTTNMKLVAQWDSGAHGSPLLNRPTAEGLRVKMTLTWEMMSVKLDKSLPLSLEVSVQMRSRSYIRPQSMLSSLWSSERLVHSTNGVYSLSVKPMVSRKAEDLWRLGTQDTYVKGEEEVLESWAPRGVSLIRDYLDTHKRRQRAAAVDPFRRIHEREAFFDDGPPSTITNGHDADLTEAQRELLSRVLKLWTSYPDPAVRILSSANTETPSIVAPTKRPSDGAYTPPSHLLATARHIPRNPSLLKAGHLLTPSPDSSRWERRYVELRVPYLHVFSTSTGDQISAINLTNSRVDAEPSVARALSEAISVGRGVAVFAIYGRTKSWVFGARDARERGDWIWAVDRCYFEEKREGGEGSERTSGRSTGYTTEEEAGSEEDEYFGR